MSEQPRNDGRSATSVTNSIQSAFGKWKLGIRQKKLWALGLLALLIGLPAAGAYYTFFQVSVNTTATTEPFNTYNYGSCGCAMQYQIDSGSWQNCGGASLTTYSCPSSGTLSINPADNLVLDTRIYSTSQNPITPELTVTFTGLTGSVTYQMFGPSDSPIGTPTTSALTSGTASGLLAISSANGNGGSGYESISITLTESSSTPPGTTPTISISIAR